MNSIKSSIIDLALDGVILIMMGRNKIQKKFEDFVRNEIYALYRWTATLSTFLIVGSFAILQFLEPSGFRGPWNKRFFWVIIVCSSFNVFLTWLWINRSLYKYYKKLESQKPKDIKRCNRIRNWAATVWRTAILLFFMFGFGSFLGYLLTALT